MCTKVLVIDLRDFLSQSASAVAVSCSCSSGALLFGKVFLPECTACGMSLKWPTL